MVDHVANCLTHSLGAASDIGTALAFAQSIPERKALLSALHRSLIVVEECRQILSEELAAARMTDSVEAGNGK